MSAPSLADIVCCSSPNIRDKVRINLEDAAAKFQSRVLNPTDAFTSSRAAERLIKKGGDAGKHGKHQQTEEALHFGLGVIEDEYEQDKSWKPTDVASGYGRKLQRYIHIKTGTARAVLAIKKAKIPRDYTRQEIWRQLEHMCKLDHPNIAAFRECFEDQQHLKLVYDWCAGGPLMTQLWRYEDKLTESHVAQIFHELLGALGSAHEFGIHHLDLGLLLIFLDTCDQLTPIKVFGLGLAGYLIPSIASRSHSITNKHFYAAPELFLTKMKNFTPAQRHVSDVWSVGSMLYTVCCGRPPYGIENKEKLAMMALKEPVRFGLEFSQYSPDLSLCIEHLLAVPWQRRPTARDAMQHRWFSKARTLHLGRDGKISSIALRDLNTFVAQDHARQTLARLFGDLGATEMDCSQLLEKFRELDLDGDGTLTQEELKNVASKLSDITPETVDQIMPRLDRNGNGSVDVSEFISALVLHQKSQDERLMLKAFCRMDRNGDARVTKKELFGILRQYSTTIAPKEISTFVSNVDQDGDHKFDYREFTAMFPHIKERTEALDIRFAESRSTIAVGPACLSDFRRNVEEWMEKLSTSKNIFEVACGKPRGDDDFRPKYNYALGHFVEFELHSMIQEIIELVADVPGYQLTQELVRIRKHKHSEKVVGNRKIEPSVLGAQTLLMERATKATRKALKKEGVSREERDSVQVGDIVATMQSKKDAGIEQWAQRLENDRADRRKDPEYQPNERMYENLYWLVKVKSELHWQPPLVTLLREIESSCVEDIRHFTLDSKKELEKLQSRLNEEYKMQEDTEFTYGDKQIFRVKKESRLLPMGSFKNAEFSNARCLDEMKEMELPLRLVFAYPKSDVTREKVMRMRDAHLKGLQRTADILSEIVKSLEDLFQEVGEDLQATCSMEARLPCPPRVSHLYLKHCQGREIQRDAVTPRSNETESDREASPSPRHPAFDTGEFIQHTGRIERNLVLKKARMHANATQK